MIVLDTHIWVWWVHDHASLSASTRSLLGNAEATGLGVSAISCWEVAKFSRFHCESEGCEWRGFVAEQREGWNSRTANLTNPHESRREMRMTNTGFGVEG